jgi:hypothetical protein
MRVEARGSEIASSSGTPPGGAPGWETEGRQQYGESSGQTGNTLVLISDF